ncbi:MAG: amidohydrolase [Terracidiphilus sp.]
MRAFPGLLAAALAGASLISVCLAQNAPARRTQARKTTPANPLSAPPDVIFFNATIYTGEGLANDKPQTVEAMAIGGGKVLAVGTTDEITKLAGPHTRLRDIDSANTSTYIFPGFNDAHVHLGSAGRTKLNLDLTGVKSLDEMLKKIAAFAADQAPGHWITGGNWDHTLWAQKTLPARQDLDRVTGDHPAFLDRIDGHIAIANTAALKAAGITGETKPPQGGAIDLDASGEPTGILRESAQGLVQKVIPPPSPVERRRGLELAIADALAHGVTSVQDFSEWDDFLTYEQMERDGKLNIRIAEWIPFKAPLEQLKEERAHHDASDPMLHTTMLKGFMDGSLGSRTAAMKEPYSDDPGNTGLPQYEQAQLDRMAAERAQAGFQIGFHAIGDKGVAMGLEALEVAAKNLPASCQAARGPANASKEAKPCLGTRNRIEHAQVVDPGEIKLFAKLGVIASMQPCHLLTDMNWAEARLGPQRAAYSYAWEAFLDAGVPLAFGTDYPVEPISPFRGVYAAVTRMNEKGTMSYFPEQKITRGQALYAYTQGSAYAEFAEKHKGKLEPGYDADFILVDRDLYKVVAPALLFTEVLETFVDGQEVYAGNMRAQ